MATETRDRVIAAAIDEFAEHGFAGARIDRIAAAAKASKERLYAWFGDKAALYALVVELDIARNTASVPFDATDLPGFSRQFYLDLVNSPTTLRLLEWSQVETHAPKVLGSETGTQTTLDRIAKIDAAQKAGTLSSRFSAYDLNALVFSTAFAWAAVPRALSDNTPEEHLRRADVLAEAVRCLIAD